METVGYIIALLILFTLIGLPIKLSAKYFRGHILKEEAKRAEIANKENKRLARLEKEKEQKLREEHLQQYYRQMILIGNKAMDHFELLPVHLKYAEEYLDKAEYDFSERAFGPFWDSIEKSVNQLGQFDEYINRIENNVSSYLQITKDYKGNPPQFPLSHKAIEKLKVGEKSSVRMKDVVRTAQRDFEFATIYEQRKTNQILVAGFNNLAQALEEMTWQITDSIGQLRSSVETMSSSLSSSLNAIHSRVGDIVSSNNQNHDQAMKAAGKVATLASQSTAREKRALAMLDNIQHRRKPSVFNN